MSGKVTLLVGAFWDVKAKTGDLVHVIAPDGTEFDVVAVDGSALVALSMPGEYVAGEHTVTAKA